jgi:hypothetical protein
LLGCIKHIIFITANITQNRVFFDDQKTEIDDLSNDYGDN